MELAALQSLINTEVLGVLGYLIPLASSLFPVAQWFFLGIGPRSHLKRAGSSSPELDLPYRVRSCLSPARIPEGTERLL
jgi:hypothetical protein